MNRQLLCIVFRRPQLKATERGWWGDLNEGASRYEERFRDDMLHTTYHVSYRFTAHDGLCTVAECVIMFNSAEEWEDYMEHYVLSVPSVDINDPYIYVKETLTGPRRFELWVMSGPLLPVNVVKTGMVYEITDDHCPRIDLTEQLVGRTMTDVRLIVEGWLYNPLVLTDNPDYDPEKN